MAINKSKKNHYLKYPLICFCFLLISLTLVSCKTNEEKLLGEVGKRVENDAPDKNRISTKYKFPLIIPFNEKTPENFQEGLDLIESSGRVHKKLVYSPFSEEPTAILYDQTIMEATVRALLFLKDNKKTYSPEEIIKLTDITYKQLLSCSKLKYAGPTKLLKKDLDSKVSVEIKLLFIDEYNPFWDYSDKEKTRIAKKHFPEAVRTKEDVLKWYVYTLQLPMGLNEESIDKYKIIDTEAIDLSEISTLVNDKNLLMKYYKKSIEICDKYDQKSISTNCTFANRYREQVSD